MNTAPLSIETVPTIDFSGISLWLRSLCSFDLAMDLGTANTLIYAKKRGILLNEPSVVALDERSRKPVAVGHQAKLIYGKTGQSISTVRPLKDGVIADFELASLMVRELLQGVCKKFRLVKPRIVIGVPSGITQVEKRAVIDAALWSGVREVHLMEESMAAALGAGLPVHKPAGNMIVDIGGGTTEVALISMNSNLRSFSLRCAGDQMDQEIQRYVSRNFAVNISEAEAERVKLALGSAVPLRRERFADVVGKDIASGMPVKIRLSDRDIRLALKEPITAIIGAVMRVLEQTPPEIAHDILTNGIHLTGGGSLLKGLDTRLRIETEVRFKRVRDPLSCVARGVGQVVENFKAHRCLCLN